MIQFAARHAPPTGIIRDSRASQPVIRR